MESSYSNRSSLDPYEDTQTAERLHVLRDAMQKMNALPARTRSNVLQSYKSSASEQIADTSRQLYAETKPDEPLVHTEPIAATCVICMSSSSLLNIDNSLFCSTCNKSALVPRVT